MTDIKRVGDSGIHTVEGAVAGSRAAGLTRQREQQKEEYEAMKNKIKQENSSGLGRIDDKFSRSVEAGEQEFRKKTVGLVSLDQFREARAMAESNSTDAEKQVQLEAKQAAAAAAQRQAERKRQQHAKQKLKMKAALSFAMDDEEEEEEDGEDGGVVAASSGQGGAKKRPLDGDGDDASASTSTGAEAEAGSETVTATGSSSSSSSSSSNQANHSAAAAAAKRICKNPNVETAFLPDRDRDARIAEQREKLRAEWLAEQERVRNDVLVVTYSYWDGGGHRREIRVRKGFTIGKFLALVKESLVKEFPELRLVSADGLIYVKEDLIIPSHHTFYDLIVTKARGKSGPLFHFDIHDDIRMVGDATVEKDESHPGKVIDRRWYEQNKHIFPASRWETYDAATNSSKYTTYTIHGDEVNGKKAK